MHSRGLGAQPEALVDVYDLAMLDLDGVVYVGGASVPHASEAIEGWRQAGGHVAFVTNNASRPPHAVVDHLVELGVPAGLPDVVTSAQAVARLLADQLGAGARVSVLGGQGLWEAVGEAGLEGVGADDDAEAVVTGYGPDVVWRDIMTVAVRVRGGLRWYASNTDMTIPTARGEAPGHGVLVETIRRFSGVDPAVAGKPETPLLEETIRRVGGQRPLMVGDRLDTDIWGGRRVGVDTLLVLTGVTDLTTLVHSPADQRPTYVAPDLRGLLVPHPEIVTDVGFARCGGWAAQAGPEGWSVSGDGSAIDWWRAVLTVAWGLVDEGVDVPDLDALRVPDPDGAADSLEP
ncbi:HAD hydrolase-like protein [Nocardioides sp. TRM66260-LWL]|uniref:HAD-IIA family hydrolase n=1 Tax=Nocardioides sp. TRM66260-LWL TaxID=2874478 RepID=UPI001CC34A4E|nr:HAD hydrolase-like protein [Nocardioides sp. TRM66260-LWL]MBZ5734137.1 HAD hydrolase-like protein [Nocardioides sp. TRM66260-LWL]